MENMLHDINVCLQKLERKALKSHNDAKKDYFHLKTALKNGNLAIAEHLVEILDIDKSEASDCKMAVDDLVFLVAKLRTTIENGKMTKKAECVIKYLNKVMQNADLQKLKVIVNTLGKACINLDMGDSC